MRRKSERAAKKAKSSPEKKVEKVKKTRTRRSRKQSTSSENESVEEEKIVPATVVADVETKVSEVPAKDDSPEDTPDQVWQVKTAQVPGETGEIQKLKICLKRPPSTPERVDRSPRSKRKHSRATSSSDTPSVEGEEKKKKHRSRRLTRESKDSEKNHESQSDEPDKDVTNESTDADSNVHEISQSELPANESVADEIPESTTVEDTKAEEVVQSTVVAEEEFSETEPKTIEPQSQVDDKDESVADTTVASPSKNIEEKQPDINISSENDAAPVVEDESPVTVTEPEAQLKEDSKDVPETVKEQEQVPEEDSADKQVSIEISMSEGVAESSQGKEVQATNRNDVVEEDATRERKMSTDSNKEKDADQSHERFRGQELERSESIQSTPEETKINGQATPIVINRRRRWGSRLSKGTTQKTITISTDILKDIIPDVKPTEFNEVIDEKKHHKRVEMSERVERPVLPKITIDNTDALEHKRDSEKDIIKETVSVSNRKISIVRDDDVLMARPPSPPRNKQSCVLYITNLVRPFTLPQLKNLLQRTGRIAEEGFWIDKIKSKCFVVYENEDQAVETRHALHGVTWPVSNPKTLQVDFSTQEAFEKAKANEDSDNAKVSTIPGTVEDWLREQDLKRERGELDKPWDRKAVREWDMGKGDKPKDDKFNKDEKSLDKRRHRTPERSPEPAKKFKKKEEEAPAKLLDDLFRKTKATPCIYWLPLSAETIAIKEEQRRQHMAEHERRLNELRRHRRH